MGMLYKSVNVSWFWLRTNPFVFIVGMCGILQLVQLMSAEPHDSYENDPLVITTTSGKVRGKTDESATGKQVDVFLSIPYAQPPIGRLRFLPPQPIEKWSGILNTMDWPNSCVQRSHESTCRKKDAVNTPLSEDCLYLSVVAPHPRPERLPVMIWIYEGGFTTGTITLDVYDYKTLASEEMVIVVAMQYRLGSLGYLYLGTSDAPGNAGMYDQLMAIQWVKDNIQFFGGDPNQVTLFGESAGASSVSFHLLSPLTQSLFQRGIMHSGSSTSPWAIVDNEVAIQRGLQLAKDVNCPHDPEDMTSVTECLQGKDPQTLISHEPRDLGISEFGFVPVVDGKFLVEMPRKSLANGRFKKTEIMLGNNPNEGHPFVLSYKPELYGGVDGTISHEDFLQAVHDFNLHENSIAHEAIAFEYTNWTDPSNGDSNRDAIDRMVGDRHFTCGVNELAHRYAMENLIVYQFLFKHRNVNNPCPKWMGTMHSDGLDYIFGQVLNPMFNYTAEERQLSRRIMRYWSNFAKYGNPNGPHGESEWPKHTAVRFPS